MWSRGCATTTSRSMFNVHISSYRHLSATTTETVVHPTHRKRSSIIKSTRERELDRVVLAMQLFYEREKHFAVPIGFQIPIRSTEWPSELRGLPLGAKTHKLMQLVANNKAPKRSETQLASLKALGFPVQDWKQYQFDTVLLPALVRYHAMTNHLFVPQKYEVPHGDETLWPRATWGYRLGLQVAKIRRDRTFLTSEQIETLNGIGFVWNVREVKWHQYFLPGLKVYKELFGHVDVPLAFKIPTTDEDKNNEWPTSLHGFHLGRHVYMIRSGKYAKFVENSKQDLDLLGFSFDISESLWTYTIFPALEVFAQVYGHCDVAQEFVVPAEDPWPENAYGYRLGHTVRSIRHLNIYEEQVRNAREALDRLGFVWNASDRVEVIARRIVIPAMKAYRTVYDNVLIRTDFIVPEHGDEWPTQARGFHLGQWITRVRSGQIKLPKKLKGELDLLGFVWRFNDERWTSILLPAFRTYAEVHGTCRGMSTKVHVPSQAPYPPCTWGLNLGGAVWHIKNGDTYTIDPVKERELKKLGVL